MMRSVLRRVLICTAALCLCLGLSPLVLRLIVSEPGTAASPPPSEKAADTSGDVFRIYDTGRETLYTVSDAEFLRGALPCEMLLSAPDEALKAQLVAIHTVYSRKRAQNADAEYDFTCDSQRKSVYMTEDDRKAVFGDGYADASARLDALCDAVEDELLLYDGEPIEAAFFAVSAGCTQPFENVWPGRSYPYLTAVVCPSDMLCDGYKSEKTVSSDELRDAFPDITFTDDPENWFSDFEHFESGYVKNVKLCGTELTGTAVREALGLRSACFTVKFSENSFMFTSLGWGHGVGMSQAGAMYMAENGSDHTQILAHFYPGTRLTGK